MLRVGLAVLVWLCAASAQAADKLAFGPPPAWVLPSPKASQPADDGGGGVRLLRLDQQLRFGPEGVSSYVERASLARTSLGLSALGTVTLNWDPALETVTVHKLLVRRGDQTIDILARQTFTILRRETELAQIVDGRLTASLQPEDLRPGDTLEFAYTTTRLDPATRGRNEAIGFVTGGSRGPDVFRLRASWPSDGATAWRAGKDVPAPKVTRRGGMTELSLQLNGFDPPDWPTGAPRRFSAQTEVELSDFRSWAEVAATVAPQFEKAAVLAPNSPLKAKAAKIRAASDDPKVRAAAALKLVQEEVRYLGLLLTDGGYTPVDADTTWTRRFGECKAKTVLLVALLRELGITAEPVLVNAFGNDGLDKRLPRMGAFNHVIVRADIGGRSYWLDGTSAGETTLDNLETPTFGWALPIRAEGAQLTPLIQVALDRPTTDVRLDIDASAGIEAAAPVKGEMVLRGTASQFSAIMAANLPSKQRQDLLKGMWSYVPGVDVKSADLTTDPRTGEARFTMTGTAKLTWLRSNEGPVLVLPQANLNWSRIPERDPGPGQDAPYVVSGFPSFATLSWRLKLPLGGEGFRLNVPNVEREIAGKSYYRRAELTGGVLSIETREKSLRAEISAAEAREAAPILDTLRATRLYVSGPLYYRPTAGDIAAWEAEDPKTATALVERGGKFTTAGRLAAAIADFEKAIAMDPSFAGAHVGRGMIRLGQNDRVGAKADFDKAISLDGRNPSAYIGLGRLAFWEGRLADAVSAFSGAINRSPNNLPALHARAEAYQQMGDFDRALQDTDELLRMDPKLLAARVMRMRIYTVQGKLDQALVDSDAAIAADPKNSQLYMYRGALLTRMERLDEAEKAFAQSLAIRPTPEAYLTRAANRPKAAVDAALVDIAAAEKLDPTNPSLLETRLRVLGKADRWQEQLPLLTKGLKAKPNDDYLLQSRAIAYVKLGKAELATRDFAALRAKAAGQPKALNNLCWTQATAGFALEAALGDCNAAVAAAPKDAHIRDSHGFVLLKLGRWRESIEAYDAALQLQPTLPQSLFGRGLAKRGLGQAAEAAADIAAARKTSEAVVKEFAEYGLTP